MISLVNKNKLRALWKMTQTSNKPSVLNTLKPK